jgi:DHA3 family macrolide efflux protein-like MFS transporter
MKTPITTFDQKNWKKLFFVIWSGQAFSIFGSSLIEFSLIWYLTDKTGSATVLSLNMMFYLLPMLLLSPFAGALVDRWNRRKVMILADTFIAITTAIIMGMFFWEVIQPWHIYIVIFMRSSAGLFHYTAMQASTSLMVPEDQLNRVNGLNQALRGGMNIIAPPIGALLIEAIPMHQILMIDIVTAVLAILPLLFVFIPQPQNGKSHQVSVNELFADIWDGVVYAGKWKGMLQIMLIAMLVNFAFNPISALMPLLVKKHFMGGAMELSWIEMAIGIGIVVGGVTLSIWGGFKKRIMTIMLCMGLTGLGFAAIGYLPSSGIYYCIGFVFLVGVVLPFIDGLIMPIIQSKGSPEYQGRLMTLLTFSSKILVPVSMLIAGPIADHYGVLFWYKYGGLMIIILTIVSVFSPNLMRVEEGLVEQPVHGVVQAVG